MIFRKSLLIPLEQLTPESFEDFHQLEEFCWDYFVRLGFHVYKIEPISNPDLVVLKKITSLKLPKDILSVGVPDFICWNSKMFFFVECKSGKSSLNEAQLKWTAKFQHLVDILVLRVKPDNKNYISKADPGLKGYSHLMDEFTLSVQTFVSIGCGTRIGKNRDEDRNERADDETETKRILKSGKAEELAYLHLARMDYAYLKVDKARREISASVGKKNSGEEKYKDAYTKLTTALEKYVNDIAYHRNKAMEHLKKTLPPKVAMNILKKGSEETESLENSYLSNETNLSPVEFKTAKEYLNEYRSEDKLDL